MSGPIRPEDNPVEAPRLRFPSDNVISFARDSAIVDKSSRDKDQSSLNPLSFDILPRKNTTSARRTGSVMSANR